MSPVVTKVATNKIKVRCSSQNVINIPKEYLTKLGWNINDDVCLTEIETFARVDGKIVGVVSLEIIKKEDNDILENDNKNLNAEEWSEFMDDVNKIIKEQKWK